MDVHTMAHFFFLDAKFLWIISVTISNLQQRQICGWDQLKHDNMSKRRTNSTHINNSFMNHQPANVSCFSAFPSFGSSCNVVRLLNSPSCTELEADSPSAGTAGVERPELEPEYWPMDCFDVFNALQCGQ